MANRRSLALLEQDQSNPERKRVALSIELMLDQGKEPPTEFRIMKRGITQTSKGLYNCSENSQTSCMEAAAQYGNDYPIDYGHAMHSYLSVDPAEAGKASGWFTLASRDDGLWATNVRWTPKAKQMLSDKEYRYFSPVFHHTDDGEVTDLVSVGLTNIPATYGMEPLMATQKGEKPKPPASPKENLMDRNLLIALLSLSSNATDDDIRAAITRSGSTLSELTQLTGQKDMQGILGAVKGFKAGSDSVAALTQRIVELEKKETEAKLSAMLDKAKQEGRVTPAMEPGLRSMPLEQLQAFLSTLPIFPGKQPAREIPAGTGSPGAGAPIQLSQEDMDVAQRLGLNVDALAKAKALRPNGIHTAEMNPKA